MSVCVMCIFVAKTQTAVRIQIPCKKMMDDILNLVQVIV